jgi:hypothetical protein
MENIATNLAVLGFIVEICRRFRAELHGARPLTRADQSRVATRAQMLAEEARMYHVADTIEDASFLIVD